MLSLYFFGLLIYCLGDVAITNAASCNINDADCVQNAIYEVTQLVFPGLPSRGIAPSDPLFVKASAITVTGLKLEFRNITTWGLKDCLMSNMRTSPELFIWNVSCLKVTVRGKYKVDGSVIAVPVEGNGDFQIVTGKIIITITSKIKKVLGPDGKNHFQFTNFTLKASVKEPLNIKLDNIFGQQALSDEFNNFANEYWKEISDLVTEPTIYPIMKKVIFHLNKYYEQIPYEDIFEN